MTIRFSSGKPPEPEEPAPPRSKVSRAMVASAVLAGLPDSMQPPSTPPRLPTHADRIAALRANSRIAASTVTPPIAAPPRRAAQQPYVDISKATRHTNLRALLAAAGPPSMESDLDAAMADLQTAVESGDTIAIRNAAGDAVRAWLQDGA